jgi:predicted phosphohydrolase
MNYSTSNGVVLVAAISDTQSKHHELEMKGFTGDILLHTGDLTQHGTKQELRAAIEWLGGLSFTYKVVIAGNHDIGLDKNCHYRSAMSKRVGTYATPEETDELIDLMSRKGIRYLSPENPSCRLWLGGRSINIFGLPYSPRYVGPSAFMRSRRIDTWQDCTGDYDILLSHSPPLGVLDQTRLGSHEGCVHFLAAIEDLRPTVAVFGHIKDPGTVCQIWEDGTTTDYFNASVMKADRTLSAPTFFRLRGDR